MYNVDGVSLQNRQRKHWFYTELIVCVRISLLKQTDTIHFHSRQLKNDYLKISVTRKLVKLMQK